MTSPLTPVLLSPINEAIDQNTSIQLKWYSLEGATTYHLQLSADSQFSTFAINDSALMDTSNQVTSLINNTTYYWRVRAKNEGGMSAFSATWNFTTITQAPDKIVLLQPENNGQIYTDTIAFSWNRIIPPATKFWFEVSVDSLFLTSQVDSNLTDTSYILRNLFNQTYWWRVRGYNVGGWGSYSEVRHFAINVTDVENDKYLPFKTALYDNYPNPFNPSTVISYELSNTGYVSLKVYNILGELVRTLLEEIETPGYKTINFDAANLPAGIYIYHLSTPQYSHSQRMVYIK